MPYHPITFLWVQRQEYERGMTHQELERATRLAARRRIVPSDREPILQPVTTPGGSSSFGRWIHAVALAISDLGHRWPRPASTQTGSTGA